MDSVFLVVIETESMDSSEKQNDGAYKFKSSADRRAKELASQLGEDVLVYVEEVQFYD